MSPDQQGKLNISHMRYIVAGSVWLIYGQMKAQFLWVPVLIGSGIALYFSLQAEPPLWIAYALITISIACFVLAYFKRKAALNAEGHGVVPVVLMALGFVCLGMFSAQLRALHVATPVIERVIETQNLRGLVEEKSLTSRGFVRLTIKPFSIEGLDKAQLPRRVVLVSYRLKPQHIFPGQVIEASARLEPSYRPTHPEGYDPARRDYFMSIGARGRLLGDVKLSTPKNQGLPIKIEKLRHSLSEHIMRHVTARTGPDLAWHIGPFATALLTGQRSLMDADLTRALRASGLAHILAISGLHMVLLTGALFFAARLLLALSSRLALTHPIKKYASIIAIIGGVFYLLISGAPISAQRAFIMVAIAFLAVIFDRRAISLHNLALAAVIILLLRPESLTSISFQMSFASVAGLVAFYEFYQRASFFKFENMGMWRGPILFFSSIFLTTLIASFATLPFVAHYFGAVPTYGLLANMLVMPIFSVVTMPLALLALFLTPFGVSGFAFELMGHSLSLIADVAYFVSRISGSVLIVPHIPLASMICVVVAGLWFLLWRKPTSLLCLLPLLLAGYVLSSDRKPDVLISERGRLIAIKADTRHISLSDKGSSYVAGRWLQYYGDDRGLKKARNDGGVTCDRAGCVARLKDAGGRLHTVSLVRERAILQEECGKSDLLIIAMPVHQLPKACVGPQKIISRLDLWRGGSHALYLGRDGAWHVKTAAAQQGARPWNREWVYQQKRTDRPGKSPRESTAQ